MPVSRRQHVCAQAGTLQPFCGAMGSREGPNLSSMCSQGYRPQQSIGSHSQQMDMPSSPGGTGASSQSRKKRKIYTNDDERKERRRLSNRLSAKRMRQQRSMAMNQIQEEVYRLRQICHALQADNQQAMQEFHALREENEMMQLEISRLEANLSHANPSSCTGGPIKASPTCNGMPLLDSSLSPMSTWDVNSASNAAKLFPRGGKLPASSPQLPQLGGAKPTASMGPQDPLGPAMTGTKATVHITHSMTITPHQRPDGSWQSGSTGTKAETSSDMCSSRSASASGGSDAMLPLLVRSPTLTSLQHDSMVKKEQVYSPTLSTPTSWHNALAASGPSIGVLQRKPAGAAGAAGPPRSGPNGSGAGYGNSTTMDKKVASLLGSPSLSQPVDENQAPLGMPYNNSMQPAGNAFDGQASFNGGTASAATRALPSPNVYYDMMGCSEVLQAPMPAGSTPMPGPAAGPGKPTSLPMPSKAVGTGPSKLDPGSPMAGSQELSSTYWADCVTSCLDSTLRTGSGFHSPSDNHSWLLG